MKRKRKIPWHQILFLIIETICIIAICSLIWAKGKYGGIEMNAIVFQLFMPMVGTPIDTFMSYFAYLATTALQIVTISVCLTILYNHIKKQQTKAAKIAQSIGNFAKKWSLLAYIIMFISVICVAEYYFGFASWTINQIKTSDFIEQEYVDPNEVQITFPEEKKNLIYILIESGETTNQDIQNGGVWKENYIPEMTTLAQNNISFSQTTKLEGASVAPYCTWSVAAIVAQTSGVPLKTFYPPEKESNGQYSTFLPGVTSLGEILETNGYKNYFMAGSDFDFGCGTEYLVQHGNYKMLDYKQAISDGVVPEDYYVWWGFEDQKLYSYAKEQLSKISQSSEPFNFTLMTIDTHSEDGYVCESCENEYPGQYENVWRCASKQLNNFIDWIKQQPFYENTTIVIVGDHCSMDVDFYENIVEMEDRKIYNCFINSAIHTNNYKNRNFTTLDMFPTILASIGANIDGNRLGLGTNLFSNKETLVEEFGYDYVFEELQKSSSFYKKELSH